MHTCTLKGLSRACALFAIMAGASMQAQAAFTLTTTTGTVGGVANQPTFYTIDTDAGLVFKIRAYDNNVSTQSAGDISSLRYNGVEYSDQTRGTQLNSGADFLYTGVSAVGVSAEAVDANGVSTPASAANNGVVVGSDFIKITLTSNGGAAGALTHYYIVKKGDPRIYMGTYFTGEPNTLGLVRYIVRVPIGVLPNGTASGTPGGAFPNGTWPDDLRGTTGAIESGDVFGFSSGPYTGETRSKHYSNQRLKDWTYIGGTGPNIGLWIVRDNNEGNSGGPFYRSLLNQITSTTNEITYIVNYGEGQTEGFRFNRLNSYTLAFTDGTAPAPVDTAFFSKLNLLGYVPASGRGSVFVPAIYGRNALYPYTVTLSNSNAQFWGDAASSDGQTTINGVLAGDYTMTVYKNELAVATAPVTVNPGTTNIVPAVTIGADPLINSDDPRGKWHIAKGDPSFTPALFRIGEWDGTPRELLNGDKLTVMHPQDVRMSNWLATATATNPYIVGSSKAALQMPAYQWKGVNGASPGPVTINFTLKASQISAASTYKFRIGITTAQAGGRPQISVNAWNSGFVGSQTGDVFPPGQPSTRTMTVGTYRARNITYDYTIPASALVAGVNTLKIGVVSGSSSTSFWLTPAVAFDAMDLIKTP
ncbi:MAG: rhamnogalacturonan lyase B N-terminal domain-containing protein [Massilia sp.]